ncbi:hypothetical protein B0J13DRAFT_500713 [Dactylonectria estremocensis]|uniref:Ketoreductase domain-containing protein n=1 Tax=Dactylonectria estremocensis TaxID=1079267 RepID=A0A9P9EWZ2_9HYPO|nr:hypothetical protein B0J13DRAFT_500713 [Dactylonectria estremocensis]
MTTQYSPRLHNEIYPFIEPAKFKGSLQDKVVLITGSTGTIGRALAECFAVAGAKLVLVYNRTPAKPDFKEQCTKLGVSSVTFIQCDISDLTSCRELVKKKSVGSIDVLVNNAGVDHLGPLHSHDPERLLDGLAVNLLGPFYPARLVIPGFMQRKQGCIINIASRGGTIDIPFNTIYSTSKAALTRMTSCWQLELDSTGCDDIHMYALHPGAVHSELTSAGMTPLGLYPHVGKMFLDSLKTFKDSPHLSGMVSVALATGIAKEALKGKYFNVQQDLEDVITQASTIRADPELYTLNTKFLGGLENDGGTEKRAAEDPFQFPGF